MDLKEEIKGFAKSIGIDIIRFTGIEPLVEVRDIIKKRQEEGIVSPFESNDLAKRINPLKIMPQAKSIIVLGISYYYSQTRSSQKSKIALYTRVIDYHKNLRSKMKLIMDFISQKLSYTPDHKFLVDTSPLIERAIALRAGIGWLGKNASIYNNKYGSFINLGEILIDYEFEPDQPLENKCLSCNRCIEACPTGALYAPYSIDPRFCLSYWTQAKQDIPKEIMHVLGDRIIGCDTCQLVCPHNKEIETGRGIEEIRLPELDCLDILSILHMNNKDYKKTFGKTAASWCGKRVLQRNALIALANSGDKKMVREIIPFLSDERPQIRKVASWALAKLGGEIAYTALKEHLKKEKDELVKNEIVQGLKNFTEEHKIDDEKLN